MTPFFHTEARRTALIEELKGWKGTRFWPGCGAKARKGVGADCVSFVERVLVSVGAIKPIEWPPYVAIGGGAEMLKVIISTIDKIENVQAVWLPGDTFGWRTGLIAGDFLLRSYKDDHHHLAIYAGDNTLWNIRSRRGVCTANFADRHAEKTLKAVYRVYE